MTRQHRIENRDRFFFVTTNMSRGMKPLTAPECELILAALSEQRQRGEFFLFGYVVMPTHLHVLLYPNNKDLIQIMRNLKSKTGYEISRRRGARRPVWQERYFDVVIRRVRNFWEKLDYLHRNTVQAGFVAKAADWPWSSYRHYIQQGQPPVPIDPVGFSSDGDDFLWPAPWR